MTAKAQDVPRQQGCWAAFCCPLSTTPIMAKPVEPVFVEPTTTTTTNVEKQPVATAATRRRAPPRSVKISHMVRDMRPQETLATPPDTIVPSSTDNNMAAAAAANGAVCVDDNVYAQPIIMPDDESSLTRNGAIAAQASAESTATTTMISPVYRALTTLGAPVVDKEHGMLAMFAEINENMTIAMPVGFDTEPAQLYMNAVFARLFQVYAQTVQATAAAATSVNGNNVVGQVTRDLTTTDAEYGMTAMVAELGQQFPSLSETNAKEYMDAVMAHLMHAYQYTAEHTKHIPGVVQDVSRDITTTDDEYGMTAMFQTMAEQFPDLSAAQAQAYMLQKYRDMTVSAAAAVESNDNGRAEI